MYFFYKSVRFYVDYRIKPHIPPFVIIPANSVSFEICNYTHQVDYLNVNNILTIIQGGDYQGL